MEAKMRSKFRLHRNERDTVNGMDEERSGNKALFGDDVNGGGLHLREAAAGQGGCISAAAAAVIGLGLKMPLRPITFPFVLFQVFVFHVRTALQWQQIFHRSLIFSLPHHLLLWLLFAIRHFLHLSLSL